MLNILRTQGRAPAPIHFEVGRDLVEADVAVLGTERGIKAPPIKKLRDSHHQVARLLAEGAKPGQVSAISGYSLNRISILQADPSFKELVEFYRVQGPNAAFADLRERMTTMSLDALEELRSRLEETPDVISAALLLDIVKVTADRTGHAPAKGNVTVNVNLELARRLEAARSRAGLAPALSDAHAPPGPVIEGEIVK